MSNTACHVIDKKIFVICWQFPSTENADRPQFQLNARKTFEGAYDYSPYTRAASLTVAQSGPVKY